jgi:hypothetical protein
MQSRRSRFLFLFGIFVRSVQFLNTIGFRLEDLYSALDKTLVIAEKALDGIYYIICNNLI